MNVQVFPGFYHTPFLNSEWLAFLVLVIGTCYKLKDDDDDRTKLFMYTGITFY